MIKVKRGLDIPISGKPEQRIHPGPSVRMVGVLGQDYGTYKHLPTLLVNEGDRVRLGQPLVQGKHLTSVTTTSPGSGVVEYIERGARRFLRTIAIRLEGDEEESFNAWPVEELASLNAGQVRENLLASGLWRREWARIVLGPADAWWPIRKRNRTPFSSAPWTPVRWPLIRP